MSLTIRRARRDDLAAVAQLLTDAAAWLAGIGSDQWQEPVAGRRRDRIAAGIAAGDVWVVERDGSTVATITIDKHADPEFWQPQDDPGSALYAHRMVVARSEAGRDLGAALLDFASRRAEVAGGALLRLDAWSSNAALQDYYRRQGFTHVRTHRYAHRGSGALFQRPAGMQLGRGPALRSVSERVIRPAGPDEVPDVLAMREEAAAWLAARGFDQWSAPWPDAERMTAGVRRAVDVGDVWVVQDGDDLVATLTLDTWANPDLWTPEEANEPARYVHRLIVRRRLAGVGLGAELLDWCGDHAARAGGRWLRLDAWTTNRDLHRYYLDHGFTHVRTRRLAHNPSGALFQRPARRLSTPRLQRA